MSKFNSILESNLNSTSLTRIRIKHDPASEVGDHKDYVGYVLEEDGVGNIVAIVPELGPDIMSFEPDEYHIEDDMEEVGCGHDDQLIGFKKHVVSYLMSRGYQDKVSEYMDTILAANNPHELEQVIGNCGCGVEAILDMYRDFVAHG